MLNIHQAASKLKQGGIIAYPTEAVFGLGCCPHNEAALTALIEIKRRHASKGVILIASDIAQVLPYIDKERVTSDRWETIQASWPGPFTWVFPSSSKVLPLIKGDFPTVAVRVSAHPIVRELCNAFGGAIVSTSANVSQQDPLRTADEVVSQFGNQIAGVVGGELGGALKPTTIQDAMTGKVYR